MKTKFLLFGISIFVLFIQLNAFAQEVPDYANAQEYDLNEYGPTNPTHFADLNGTLFFSVGPIIEEEDFYKSTSSSKMDIVVGLYKMDGTAPILVMENSDWYSINNVTAIGNYVYFAANKEEGSELWRTDGADSELIKVFSSYVPEPANIFKHEEAIFTEINFITEFNGSIFFSADDGEHGDELWISDGTTAGTTLFKEIHEGSDGASITALMVFGDHFYFPADDGIHGSELWISDGTAEGTVLHEDIYMNPVKAIAEDDHDHDEEEGDGSLIEDMVIMGDFIYFVANDGSGIHLWKSNASGTAKVTETVTTISRLESFDDNVLYFSASFPYYDDSPEYGLPVDPEFPPTPPGAELKLWKYDIADGLVQIDDGFLDVNTEPKKMTKSGDLVYFAQNNRVVGRELWASDGDVAWLVKNIFIRPDGVEAEDDPNYIPPSSAWPSPRNFIDINGKLFFTADVGDGSEYWRSDGTEEGTVQVTDINPIIGYDVNSPEEEYYGVFNNVFYFPATSSYDSDKELWSVNILHFTTQPASAVKYVGDTGYSLTAVAVGEGEVTYQWQKDGVDIEDATTSTLAFATLTKDDAATYTCTVSDVFYGALVSDDAVLEVYYAINITEQPDAYTSICEWNTDVTLSVVANSAAEIGYQWYKDGVVKPGYNESTITIANNPFNAGTYACLLVNEDMEVWTEEAVVEIGSTTNITKHPTSRENLVEGTDVTFLVIAEGTDLRYQWRKNGINLSNGGNVEGVFLPVLSVDGVTAADEGEYGCVVIGECLVLASQIASLTVADTEDDGVSTSLDELAKQGISVFPNPSDGRFAIQFKEVINEVLINIYDVTGKAVYSNAAKADYFDIDISKEPIGIYILRMEFDNKIINSKIILE